jgi:hypothetical protein
MHPQSFPPVIRIIFMGAIAVKKYNLASNRMLLSQIGPNGTVSTYHIHHKKTVIGIPGQMVIWLIYEVPNAERIKKGILSLRTGSKKVDIGLARYAIFMRFHKRVPFLLCIRRVALS